MIPVNQPRLGRREKALLAECIDTGWISSEGPFVKEFETRLASRAGRRYGIAVSNGTAALDVAIAALGIGQGDEVIVPTFTIISCVTQILRCGARPVFVDCEADSWNMRVDQVETRISPRTKAIMAVHIYGLPVDMAPLVDIADRHALYLIEDASEAIGQTYAQQPCGSFGDISTFSFYPNKHITTGEGGMLLVNSPDLAQRCRSLRNLCFQSGKRFYHEELGWNYRMTNLQAALGVAQLEQLDEFLARKREIGAFYNRAFEGLGQLQLPLPRTDHADNLYWVYGVLLSDGFPLDATAVMALLGEAGIGSRPFFWPLHEQPVVRTLGMSDNSAYPVAERIARRGLYLPSGLGTTDNDLQRVADELTGIVG